MNKQEKEARLAAALRENLRKRKAGAVPTKIGVKKPEQPEQ
jgi:hypothetical protein